LLPALKIVLTGHKPELLHELSDDRLATKIKRRRRLLGLKTERAAAHFQIAAWSYRAWELGRSEPSARNFPALINWLGYEPWSAPQSLGERLRAERRRRGLFAREVGRLIGTSETVIINCEGEREIARPARARIEAFLNAG
jgi:DNA-binding XRE family transcriptional regulator